MSAVYIDSELKLKTTDVPHKKIIHNGHTWMIAPLPAGDFVFHRYHFRDRNGYGGSIVDFLMDNGEIESLMGPYVCYSPSDFGTAIEAERLTGISGVLVQASKITVGKNLGRWTQTPEIVYSEKDWHLGDWKDRVKKEWRGLEFAITKRGSIMYPPKDDIAEMFRRRSRKSKHAIAE